MDKDVNYVFTCQSLLSIIVQYIWIFGLFCVFFFNVPVNNVSVMSVIGEMITEYWLLLRFVCLI